MQDARIPYENGGIVKTLWAGIVSHGEVIVGELGSAAGEVGGKNDNVAIRSHQAMVERERDKTWDPRKLCF